MTIAFLLQDTGALYGAERATLELAKGVKGAGFSVLVLLIQETRLGLVHSVLEDAFRAAQLAVFSLPTSGRFSKNLATQILEICQDQQVSILHTTGYKADVHGVYAVRGRVPLLSTIHGWLFRRRPKEIFYQWLNLLALRQFTRVVVLSRWYERYVNSRGISQTTHIPPGMQPDAAVPGREASTLFDGGTGPFTFGMLGRLSEEKNHAQFLSAAREIVQRNGMNNLRFLVAGDGPLRLPLEARAEKMGLSPILEFTGYVPGHEFFRRIQVLVQCSMMENQPVSVLEGMAWKKPVIATNVGGLPEMLIDQETGFLVRPGDAKGLAVQMMKLAADRAACVKMGLAGRKLLEKRFSWGQMMAGHVRLYHLYGQRISG